MNFFDDNNDEKVIDQTNQINDLIKATDEVIKASDNFRSVMNQLNVSDLPLKKSDKSTIDYAFVVVPSASTLETLKKLLSKALNRYEVDENQDGMTHF